MAAIEPVTYKTDLKKRARTANISYPVHLGVRRAACRTTPEGTVMQPKAQGQRSGAYRLTLFAYVLCRAFAPNCASGDQHGLV